MAEVVLDEVSVSFPVFNANGKSLGVNMLYLGSGGMLARDRRGHVSVAALSRVSLRAATGDRIAVIGRNGSGKSTLLKVIAGIYRPTSGRVSVDGRISTVLGVGLVDEELTGWEAIDYACLLRGIPRRRVAELREEIADFTELGSYLAVPVRTYSAGMKMRLGFAVATCDAPEVLLIDEVIGSGDVYFLEKARQRARNFLQQSNILFLASHSESMLRNTCRQGIVLDRGQIVAAGPIDAALQAYHDLGVPARNRVTVSAQESGPAGERAVSGQPFASSSASDHLPDHAFDGHPLTYWLSAPGRTVNKEAFIGFDAGPGRVIDVRYVALRQRALDLDGTGCVARVAVQASDDGFEGDVRTVTTLDVRPDISSQTFEMPPAMPARWWRLLALTDAGRGGWGVSEIDFASQPVDRLGGRPIGSEPVGLHAPIEAAFDGSMSTQWIANERGDSVEGNAWIGWDFGPGGDIEVRRVTIRQWNGGGRPNTVPAVKVQYSSDSFQVDVRTADTVKIVQDTERHTYEVAASVKARHWRILAGAPTGGGHWGLTEVHFSEQ